ncbi:inosine/xanthosine triphosphatase [Piscirickettsia litoralis]|uniref:Inosine/xanthosine triphosphatase n=1 Tax=Piscirickettsia litoralis TaxID=1891921 RepID=A0ABX3A3L1_9GAMM|nr:inosine/xanthosine triphosphatase [Piscirickettsia litoralis]ODN43442.1 inosine/xanthosine triphosphatase [Piscirickettsia litoralis]
MKKDLVKVIVGSQNPVKINAVKAVMIELYPESIIACEGLHAPSQVADQPMTEDETRIGAINRVNFCKEQVEADFYVAMEGGVDCFEYGPATFAYVVIANQEGRSIGRSANLPLPKVIYQALIAGEELGHVMDRLFNTKNIKQQGGAIGLLTNGHASRESCYIEALTLAMAPVLHEELY